MQPVHNPFRIIVANNEKAPYTFDGFLADTDKQERPLVIPWELAHLKTGDYSIAGMEDRVTIERKSLADLYSTLGKHRARFEREHQRMAEMEFAAVVVESSMANAVVNPPERSQLHPKTVYRTSLSWAQRYGVHWIWAGDRRGGEITTFQLLRFFYRAVSRERRAMSQQKKAQHSLLHAQGATQKGF